jgi:glutamate-1-semialdehyde 2,1-aminomutase
MAGMTNSQACFQRAARVTPGGVHSPVRSFAAVGGSPRFMERARGSRIQDVDGQWYTDYCMAFGPMILGHRDPDVASAAVAAIEDGWSYGAADPYSLRLAELIVSKVPHVEQIRFVNSGTEAVMSALRVVRGATGRSLVMRFAGCYHGHTDSMLVAADPNIAYRGLPDSAGVPAGVVADTLVLPLDDEAALEDAFATYGSLLAGAIIEPLPANHGLLPQRAEYLRRLRQLCSDHGALLIFDEVITGFRTAFGGMAQILNIKPDLATYGKVLGGGFPMAAFGGTRTVMEHVAPAGPVFQAGTYSANPLAARAGLATLEKLADGRIYQQLDDLGSLLRRSLGGLPGLRVTQVGSLFWLDMSPAGPAAGVLRQHKSPQDSAARRYQSLFRYLLQGGIYLPPSPLEVGFLSSAHTGADIVRLTDLIRHWSQVVDSSVTERGMLAI